MNSFVYLSAIGLLICSAYGRAIDEPDNSIIQSDDSQYTGGRDWVKISEAPPPKIIQQIGSSVELECEVSGSPAPTVQWVRGNKPVDSINDFDSNLISESSPSALVRVRSRLIIDRMSLTERTFTCVGHSGSKTTFATTTVYPAPSNSHNITDLLSRNSLSGPRKTRIVLFYSVIFETIGRNVLLPCKAAGLPHPEIYWLDPEENIVNEQSGRYKVLSTGELLITSLRWSDMGTYTCIARNPLAKDTATSFVYPISDE